MRVSSERFGLTQCATGKASLCLSEDTTGDHRIFDSGDARQSVEIDTLDLDAYFRDYTGRIDFIKMDIQGPEDAALCGTVKLLETHGVERILMEFWPTGLKAYGVRPDAPLRLLESRGFHILDLDEPEQCVVRRTIPKLVDKYTSGRRTWTNLFCTTGHALRTWRDKYPQRGGRL
ncbi:MAG: FkbM family methyltransferase [Acidobacteriota bacterium]